MDKPTDKQLKLIRGMEMLYEPFEGATKREASQYISKHIEHYKLDCLDDWHFINGYI